MYLHAITPGDHFSPRTGSAVPTVVDGLSRGGGPTSPPSGVLVARGTYEDRYDSADAIEYTPRSPLPFGRYVDAASSGLTLPRFSARRVLAAAVADQAGLEPSIVLAHNAVQLVRPVRSPHVPVLYAHNELLRTYSRREAGRALDPAPVLVCVSRYIAQATAARLPARLHERLVVVPNGVDTTRTPSVPRSRGDRLHVVFVGRTIADKGPDLLVEAVRMLGRDDIAVTIVGADGFAPDAPPTSYERDLRRTAEQVRGPVTFTGFMPRDGVHAVLATADLVVVPSRWPDPHPLTPLEGMAAGAAVIGADIGGIPEAIEDAGLLVPPGDARAIAGAIAALADDEGYLLAQQHSALAHARRRDWSTSRRRLDEVLAPVLPRHA